MSSDGDANVNGQRFVLSADGTMRPLLVLRGPPAWQPHLQWLLHPLLEMILARLDTVSLARVSGTCRRLRRIAQSSGVWESEVNSSPVRHERRCVCLSFTPPP